MNDKTVVLNAGLVNYDGKVDYSSIASDVVIYEDTPEELILERVQGCTIVVTKEMKLPGHIIRRFPECVAMICEAGTGYNNIDIEAVREKGIILCNIPAYSSERVAHTGIMMLLNLASSMQQQIRMLAAGNKDNFQKHLMVNHMEVNGKTLGLIGYGNIAKEMAKVALALGMKIIVFTRTPRTDEAGIRFTDFETVLKESDFLSLHCPLNESTHHIIDTEALSMMKPTAYIINTARGALIDEAALIDAITSKRLAGAGLDVQEREPLPEDSPLYAMDSVIITPHIGWRGVETRQRLVKILRDNIQAFVNGAPINRVD